MKLQRQIFKRLEEWKTRVDRKPLLLRGARQVGKTTLINEFAKTYAYNINLNLERAKHLRYFNDFSDASKLVEALFLAENIPSDQKTNTLLFIDEIQESPKAISLLRYFYEDIPELHVVAAGSLLEHIMRNVPSIPVGRVEYLYIHPLNFTEYLNGKGHNRLLEEIQKIPVKEIAHSTLLQHFHEFAIIEGMPEVVNSYVKNGSLSDLSRIYEAIWSSYKEDVKKYAKNATEARVISHIINTAHIYIDQRIKFQNFGNSNYK